MAFSLTDVVEIQGRQRASSAQRKPAETREASRSGQADRERFALRDKELRATSAARERASSTTKTAAPTVQDKAQNRPEPKAGSPSRESSQGASKSDRKIAEQPKKPPASATSVARGQAGKPQAGRPDEAAAGADSSQDATTDTASTVAKAEGEAASGTSDAATDSSTVTASAIPVFVVPPAPVPLPSTPLQAGTVSANGATTDDESEIEAAGIAAGSPGSSAAKGTVAAKPGFDAALAAAVPDGAAEAVATATAPPEPSAGSGPATASTSVTDAKAAAATQPQAQPALPAAVPLGAVPMTIGLRALGASNRFEIRLDPKELGRIDVSLDIDKDTGTVGARLVVDRPETLALLQRDAASLQQALSQTGLDASAGISLSLRGGEGEGRRGNGETGADAQARSAGQQDHTAAPAGPETSLLDLVPLRALRGIGRVDIRI